MTSKTLEGGFNQARAWACLLFCLFAKVLAGQSVDLSVVKSTPPPATVGVSFSYTVTVTNIGGVTATGVTVTDVLPPGISFVPAGSSAGCAGNGQTETGITVTCPVGMGTLNPSGQAAVTIVVSATAQAVGTVTNVVGVIANEPDGSMANNSATSVTTILGGSPPPVPTGLVATATSTSAISISWNASGGATSYVLERSSLGSAYAPIASPTTNSWADPGLAIDRTYLYQVKAVGPGGTSGPSNRDLATTVIFLEDPFPAPPQYTTVKAQHFTQLRLAVNAVQVAANQQQSSWSTPAPSIGGVIKAIHVEELRSALASARTVLGYADPPFDEAPLVIQSTTIKRFHVQQLRDRVK